MAYLGCINLYTRGDKPKRFLSADFIRKNILYDSKQKYVKSGKGWPDYLLSYDSVSIAKVIDIKYIQ